MHSEGIPCLQSRVGSVIKALQPMLDVLSRNAKCPFSETLLLFHGVLVSNRLDTSGLLIIRRYIYGLHRFPPACMAIAFEQALSGSPHRSLDCLLAFHGSEGSSEIVCNNTAEVVCRGHCLTRAQSAHANATFAPTI